MAPLLRDGGFRQSPTALFCNRPKRCPDLALGAVPESPLLASSSSSAGVTGLFCFHVPLSQAGTLHSAVPVLYHTLTPRPCVAVGAPRIPQCSPVSCLWFFRLYAIIRHGCTSLTVCKFLSWCR